MTEVSVRSGVGPLLRDWRRRRRRSQMDLALDAGVSARHVSFVESGRSRPSAEMVVRLAEQLEVPLRDRNELLLAAGYAPLYGERPLDDPDMTPVREALELVLRGHEPYPAAVVDRWWEMVAANSGIALLTEGVAPELLAPPANVMRVALHPDGMAPRIVNFGEWRAHLLERLRHQASVTGDAALGRALRGGQRLPRPGRRRRPPRRRGRGLRPARLPRRRRPRAALLQHGGDLRHGGRHHGGRARDRVVLPGGFRDGRGAARRVRRRAVPPS